MKIKQEGRGYPVNSPDMERFIWKKSKELWKILYFAIRITGIPFVMYGRGAG